MQLYGCRLIVLILVDKLFLPTYTHPPAQNFKWFNYTALIWYYYVLLLQYPKCVLSTTDCIDNIIYNNSVDRRKMLKKNINILYYNKLLSRSTYSAYTVLYNNLLISVWNVYTSNIENILYDIRFGIKRKYNIVL